MRTQSDRLQQIGTVVAIILGIWGAGLSTYQEFRAREREKPNLYTQLTLSRPPYVEAAKSRPATLALNINNSGKAPITLHPEISFVAFNPASGFSRTVIGQLVTQATYALPKTLQPGEQTTATATTPDSDALFGPNMQYSVLIQTVDKQIYFAQNIAGPIKTAEAFEALQNYVKYQSKVDFESRPALALPH
ncbi:hypothetical protein ACOTCA_06665 [Achromobacter xylosoxidans]|uniref:hypothetical protein n=1 Tax=Alcaligenes xylosoxydans xylosoxydans TaxID=85698 RepID=UPI001EEBB9DC|nr:hypothetical protein [Achromobacter xylosoxidans]